MTSCIPSILSIFVDSQTEYFFREIFTILKLPTNELWLQCLQWCVDQPTSDHYVVLCSTILSNQSQFLIFILLKYCNFQLKFCRPKIYRNVAMVGFPLPLTCEGSLINKRVQAARTPVIVRRKQVAPTPPVAQNLIEDSFSQQLSTWDYKACGKDLPTNEITS